MMKQAIILRADLGMSKGKMCAQSAHASLEAALRAMKTDDLLKMTRYKDWKNEGGTKVVLKVGSEKEILELRDKAVRESLPNALIKDAGQTEVPPGTITALGIGPDKDEKIDKVAKDLALL